MLHAAYVCSNNLGLPNTVYIYRNLRLSIILLMTSSDRVEMTDFKIILWIYTTIDCYDMAMGS